MMVGWSSPASLSGPWSDTQASPVLQRNWCKMVAGSRNYYVTSEISSCERWSPPFSVFPSFLYIVLCIILVGVRWGQFLFYEFTLTQNKTI